MAEQTAVVEECAQGSNTEKKQARKAAMEASAPIKNKGPSCAEAAGGTVKNLFSDRDWQYRG